MPRSCAALLAVNKRIRSVTTAGIKSSTGRLNQDQPAGWAVRGAPRFLALTRSVAMRCIASGKRWQRVRALAPYVLLVSTSATTHRCPPAWEPLETKFRRIHMMNLILKSLNRLHQDETGQGLVEYLLILALVAFAATAGMTTLASGLNSAFARIGVILGSYIT